MESLVGDRQIGVEVYLAAITKETIDSGVNNKSLISHRSGVKKSDIRMAE